MLYGDQEGRSNIGSRADDGQEGRSEPREESDKSAANGNSHASGKHALVAKQKTGDEKQMTNGQEMFSLISGQKLKGPSSLQGEVK